MSYLINANALVIKEHLKKANVSFQSVKVQTVNVSEGFTKSVFIGRVIRDGATKATVTEGEVIKGTVLD